MEAVMDHSVIAEITNHFTALKAHVPLHTINSEKEYETAISSLNALLDAGAAVEGHPLADLVNALGNVIGDYEAIHYPQEKVSPTDMLRLMMEQHGLSQSEVPEIGAQSVVSEILSGKRELNVRQIRALAERFHLPPSAFI
ncbi:helix-turn-helix domain-containing protein [Pseudoduganella namucuonensis]|uniref:HTH-type transcriptional regulator / antitoxin HigA n=1 Tax=Pseudoduganella namucuonensis TaxID=1035707 RepID=A0A1I7M340_9BURK|nr:helix-turn-helix domain-containing protein [Pseudoduganella namucuonensis]SFV16376.1 HTH-type transcriptional regulator / antitoxin HigA [Pseudoduganella namucuonensis]